MTVKSIRYSKRAFLDIIRLKEFIWIKNLSSANRVVNELVECFDDLLLFPDIGKEVDDSPNPDSVRDVYILDYRIRYLKLKKGFTS